MKCTEVAVDVLCRDRSQEKCKYGIWYPYFQLVGTRQQRRVLQGCGDRYVTAMSFWSRNRRTSAPYDLEPGAITYL